MTDIQKEPTPSKHEGLAWLAALLDHPLGLWSIFLLAVLVGVYGFFAAKREGVPAIEIPIAFVSVAYPGGAPADMDRIFSVPIKNEVRGLEHLRYVEITSRLGVSTLVAYYEQGTDMSEAFTTFKDAVDAAKVNFPADATIVTSKVNILDNNPLVTAVLSHSDRQLLNRVASDLKEDLESDPGVSSVELAGDLTEAITVHFDPDRMEKFAFSPSEVQSAIQTGDVVLAAGTLDLGTGRLNANISGGLDDAEAISKLPLRVRSDATTIRLSDIATVRQGYLPKASEAHYNGKQALTVNIYRKSGENIIEAAERIHQTLDRMRAQTGVQYVVTLDEGDYTSGLLSDLINTVIFSSILVALFVVLSVGFGSGLLVAAVIPVTMVICIGIIYMMGISLNMMVLFGFMMTSGMVVDAGIVIVEYAKQKMTEGMSPRDAYFTAIENMGAPVTAGMLTSVAVYAPLFFWPGIGGDFMRYLIMTVPLTLIVSLLVVIFLIPSIGIRLRPEVDELQADAQSPVLKIYDKILKWSITNPKSTIGYAFLSAFVLFAIFLIFTKGVGFFPETDPDAVSLSIFTPTSNSLQQNIDLVHPIEEEALRFKEFEHVNTRIQVAKERDSGRSDLIAKIEMVLAKDNKTPISEIRAKIEERFNAKRYPNLEFGVSLVNSNDAGGSPSSGSDIDFRITSDNLKDLNAAADDLTRYLKDDSTFVRVSNESVDHRFEMSFKVDRSALRYYGVSLPDISNYIKLFTDEGFTLKKDYIPTGASDSLDIVGFFPDTERQNWSRMKDTMIPTQRGKVPLSQFLKAEYKQSDGRIRRRDDSLLVVVGADVSEFSNLSKPQATERVMAAMKLPEHAKFYTNRTHIAPGGNQDDQAETVSFLLLAAIIGVGLILIILLFQFNSLYLVLVIASAIFFSTFGAFFATIFSQERVVVVVMFGLAVLSLAGVVVNHNIVLIAEFLVLMRQGLSKREAAYYAAYSRFRAVNLTAWTAAAGLLPGALLIGVNFMDFSVSYNEPNAQLWVQLARCTAVGMVFSTMVTLVLVPALLLYYKEPVFMRLVMRLVRFVGRLFSKRLGV